MIGRSSNYCLASIDQYYSYIQDQNKFNNIYKNCINEGKYGSSRSTTATEKE